MKFPESVIELAHKLERRVGWYRLPLPLGVAVIALMRDRLRQRNFFDTGKPTDLVLPQSDANGAGNGKPDYLTARRIDGTFNDLENPLTGSARTRFSRNVPLEYTFPEVEPRLSTPNPRTISRKLMTRKEFIPATNLNVLAAAWIQFEVHDWFSHGPNALEEPYQVELEEEDDWHERPMQIRRTPRDETSDPDGPQTWRTDNTHWWDGSQIYGREPEFAAKSRTGEGGKLRVDPEGVLPANLEEGLDYSDVPGAMWVGLYALHVLFSLEHNAICDRLRAEYPTWSDEQLYSKARLVNAALMAKIHTLDWTPALTAHPTMKFLMKVSWWGLAGEWLAKHAGRISSKEEISGIVGMPTNHFGHPYALTEEFVAVYRFHPLIPDDYTFRSLDDKILAEHSFQDLLAPNARDRLGEISMPNALYSLGIANPGAITLHNYPKFLQRFERGDGFTMDLAAVDIMRGRERGLPRYTKFREFFYMKPVRSFEELTSNPVWREEIRELYNDDIDSVDLQVGLLAESFPPGFAFSDTATRVFILMASRRLTSDRFFTKDYTAEQYTQAGLDWVADNDLRSILLRHFPQLEPALEGVENPFAPWRRTSVRNGA